MAWHSQMGIVADVAQRIVSNLGVASLRCSLQVFSSALYIVSFGNNDFIFALSLLAKANSSAATTTTSSTTTSPALAESTGTLQSSVQQTTPAVSGSTGVSSRLEALHRHLSLHPGARAAVAAAGRAVAKGAGIAALPLEVARLMRHVIGNITAGVQVTGGPTACQWAQRHCIMRIDTLSRAEGASNDAT